MPNVLKIWNELRQEYVGIPAIVGANGKDALTINTTVSVLAVPAVGDSIGSDASQFNRTPEVGDVFLLLYDGGETVAGRSWICTCHVSGITSQTVFSEVDGVVETTGSAANVTADNVNTAYADATEAQKQTARENIGAIGTEDMDSAVRASLLSNAEITEADYDALCDTIGAERKQGEYELIEKIIVGYSLTTEEPADWATAWTSYYTNTGTINEPEYMAVAGDVAPTWESGVYYALDNNGVAEIVRGQEPDGTIYRLIDVCVKIFVPDGFFTSGSNMRITFKYGLGYVFLSKNVGLMSGAAICVCLLESVRNMWRFSYFNANTPTAAAQPKSFIDNAFMQKKSHKTVGIIQLGSLSSGGYNNFPPNTVVEIWGVRS